MKSNSYRVGLGMFVLLALGLLAGMILAFGSLPGLWGNRTAYRIRFADAPGIAVGTPVRKSGIRIGEVSAVELESATGEVLVDVRLDQKYSPRVGEDPTIVRGILGNDANIDFIPVRRDKLGEMVPPGSTIAGFSGLSSNPVSAVQDLMPEVQKSLEQMRQSLRKIEEMVPKVNQTLDDFSLLAKDARAMIPDIRKTNDSLQETLAAAKAAVPEFNKTNKAIQDAATDARTMLKTGNTWIEETGQLIKRNEPKLAKLLDNAVNTFDGFSQLFNDENRKNTSELLANLNTASKDFGKVMDTTNLFFKETNKTLSKLAETLTNADLAIADIRTTTKPIGEKMGKVMENIDVASRQLALTLSDTRELLRVLSRSEGSVAKFLNDPALFNNMNEASIQFMKVMPRLDRMFKDLEVFADKIARHPESIGVGGAIRPSAGFKESGSQVPAATLSPLRPR